MAKPILFVVHGMGKHSSNWEKEIKDTMNETMIGIPAFQQSSNPPAYDKFTDYTQIVPLSYDRFFESQRKKWSTNATSVIGKMKSEPSNSFESRLSDIEAASLLNLQAGLSEDSFFNTHVLDVLLYRFTNIGERIRVSIAKTIVEKLQASDSGSISFSIMAHSLGTSVIHDTLHALYSPRKWRDGEISKTFTPKNYKASYLFMIANVSRLLQSSKHSEKAYVSKTKPGRGGVCKHMVNLSHDLDPFAQIKPFTPGDQWISGREEYFKHIHLNTITEPNVHALSHYLKNPSVHIPIIRSIAAEGTITKKVAADRYRAYKKTTLNATHKSFTNSLQALKISEPNSWQTVFEAWKDYSNLLQQYQNKIG